MTKNKKKRISIEHYKTLQKKHIQTQLKSIQTENTKFFVKESKDVFSVTPLGCKQTKTKKGKTKKGKTNNACTRTKFL